MASQYGTPINFGFTGTNGITVTNISGWLLQSVDYAKQADVFEVRDADGDMANRTFYNPSSEATLSCIITGSTIAAALTNTTLQTPGTLITITALDSIAEMEHATEVWQVEPGHRITGSNTDGKIISVPLKKFAGIQAAATAS